MSPPESRCSRLLAACCLSLAALCSVSVAEADDGFRLAFGSCGHQDKAQPIWSQVSKADPDVFVFLGDNIYGDTDDMAVLAGKWQKLGAIAGFAALRDKVEIQATWDDHDYGRNDAGAEYPHKEASRQLLLDFFAEPADSERRRRPDGLYGERVFEVGKRTVQLLLLDLRWNRTPLTLAEGRLEQSKRYFADMGPYSPVTDGNATLLGDAQRQWLGDRLQQPADVTIIASSIQVLAEFTGWESWANFPLERNWLLDKVEAAGRPVVFISGDVHWAEESRLQRNNHEHVELTSSGLTEEWTAISPNRHRVGRAYAIANFGLLDINFTAHGPEVRFEIRDVSGDTLIESAL